jgi:thymidylate synthase
VPEKEPTVIEDTTLEELLRLKTEYAEYVRRSAGQPYSSIDKYLNIGAARSLERMTPVEMSTIERIDHHIDTIQQGSGGNTKVFAMAGVTSLMSNLRNFYDSPTCPKIVCERYIETVSSWAQKFEEILHRYEHEINTWSASTHASAIKSIIKDLTKNPKSRCQCDTGWLWVGDGAIERSS